MFGREAPDGADGDEGGGNLLSHDKKRTRTLAEGTLSWRPDSSLGSVQLWMHITSNSDPTLGKSLLSLGLGSPSCGVRHTEKMTSVSFDLKIYFVIGEPSETLSLATLVGRLRFTCCANIESGGRENGETAGIHQSIFILVPVPSSFLLVLLAKALRRL